MHHTPRFRGLWPGLLMAGLSACTSASPPAAPLVGASPRPAVRATARAAAGDAAPAEPGDAAGPAATATPSAGPTTAGTAQPVTSPVPTASPVAPSAAPTAVASGAATPTPAPSATPTPAPTPSPAPIASGPVDPPADLATLEARYALPVDAASAAVSVAISGGTITAKAPDAAKLAAYEAMLPTEWGLYPPGLIAKSGLKRLVLCEQLAFGGQARAAVPDPRSNALYLDVAPGSPEYRRAVLHHEYFHMVDFADDGQLYADAAWTALNRPGFAYDRGGAFRQGRGDQYGLVDDEPGFLTYYATAGVEEDKAETFCFLMLYPAVIEARAVSDPVFGTKLARMKALLAAFVPAMDAAYWEALKAHRAGSAGP